LPQKGSHSFFFIFVSPQNRFFGAQYLEVIYAKGSTGDQVVCLGDMDNACSSNSDDYVGTFDPSQINALTFCYDVSTKNDTDSIYLSIAGTCETTSLCYSSTDVAVDGVRLFSTTDASSVNSYGCPNSADAETTYLPFYVDQDGGNTAFYYVTIDEMGGMFQDPVMVIPEPDTGSTTDLYIVLDIDEIDASNYAVEFHYIFDDCATALCQDGDNATDYFNATQTGEHLAYPVDQWMLDENEVMTGSYATGPVTLDFSYATEDTPQWTVNPYVFDMGLGEVQFRYCAGRDFECSDASATVPSIALFGALAMVARFFQ
jgi:hypothetical protein